MEIEILPNRLLKDETAIKFLNKLRKIEGILEIMVFGPRYQKRTVYLGKNQVQLIIKIGRFWLVIDKEYVEGTLMAIKEICEDSFCDFGYTVQPKRFVKKQKSLRDYIYGSPILKGFLIHDDVDEEEILEFDSDFTMDEE